MEHKSGKEGEISKMFLSRKLVDVCALTEIKFKAKGKVMFCVGGGRARKWWRCCGVKWIGIKCQKTYLG